MLLLPQGYKQYQIAKNGKVSPPESWPLITRIDTLEFPKWEVKVSNSLKHWVNMLGVSWVCFGSNVSSFKHAPFCHNARSYTKREADWMNNDVGVIVSKFLS